MRTIRFFMLVCALLPFMYFSTPASAAPKRAKTPTNLLLGPIYNTVPDLILLLKSPYPRVRRFAIYMLGEKGAAGRPAVKHLVGALSETRSNNRSFASDALIKIWRHEHSQPRGELLGLLRSPEIRIRYHAISITAGLGPRGTKYRSELLRIAMQSKTMFMVMKALKALAKTATSPEHLRPILKIMKHGPPGVPRKYIRRRYQHLGDALVAAQPELLKPFVPELKGGLRRGSTDYKRAILSFLSYPSVDARPFGRSLLVALDDADNNVLASVLYALSRLPDIARTRKPKILSLFRENRDWIVRMSALHLLSRMGALNMVGDGELIAALDAHEGKLRGSAENFLEQRRPSAEVLLKALNGKHYNARVYAEKALRKKTYARQIATPDFVRKLHGLLRKGNCWPLNILATIGKRGGGPGRLTPLVPDLGRLHAVPGCRPWARRALAAAGPAGVAYFLKHLRDGGKLNYESIHGLEMSGLIALPRLIQLLRDSHVPTRRMAAELILKLAQEKENAKLPGAKAALQAALSNQDAEARLYAVLSLIELGLQSPKIMAVMRELCSHSDHRIRRAALLQAGKMGSRAMPILGTIVAALDDPLSEEAALEAVERMGPAARSALPRLFLLKSRDTKYGNDGNLARLAPTLAAVGARDERTIPALISILRLKGIHSHRPTMEALAEMGNKALPALPHVLRFLKEEDRGRSYKESERFREDRQAAFDLLLNMHEGMKTTAAVQRMAAKEFLANELGKPEAALRLLRLPGELDTRSLLLLNIFRPTASSYLFTMASARDLGRRARGDAGQLLILRTMAREPRHDLRIRWQHAAAALAAAGEFRSARNAVTRFKLAHSRGERPGNGPYGIIEAIPFVYHPDVGENMLLEYRKTASGPGSSARSLRLTILEAREPIGPRSQKSALNLRRLMNDARLTLDERLGAARVLLHKKSPFRRDAIRFVITLTRTRPKLRARIIPLLEKYGGQTDGSREVLRDVAATDNAPMRRRARIAIRRIKITSNP